MPVLSRPGICSGRPARYGKGTCQGRARDNRTIPTSIPLCGRPMNGSSCNNCSCLSIFIVRFIQHDDELDRPIKTYDKTCVFLPVPATNQSTDVNEPS